MTAPPAFPFAAGPASEPPPEYARIRQGVCPARGRLAGGREARLLTRHDEVRQVLADPRFSRSAYTAGTLFARSPDSLPLNTTDAPVHTRRRAAVAAAFTARRVRALRPMVERLAAERLAALAAGPGSVDLVDAFTVPFTLRVMCRILGVPESDAWRFKPWVDPMMSIGRYPPATVARCHAEYQAYFADLVDRPSPDGLVAAIAERGLARTETVALAAGTFIAGYETTSNVLAVAVYHLLRRPELAGRLRRDPELAGPVVEELLRYVCGNGTGGVPHVATAEVTLAGGEVVAPGTVVVPIPDAANRDPDVFDSPDTLRPDRAHNPHVAFGHGPHHCLGAELARLELRVGLTGLLTTFPDLRVAVPEERLRWRTDMFVRGLWELPVTLGGEHRG